MQRRYAGARFVAARRNRAGLTLKLEAIKGPGADPVAPAPAAPTFPPAPLALDCPAVYAQFTAQYGPDVFAPGKCEKRLNEFEEMTRE